MNPGNDSQAFYEDGYSTHDERNQRWRSLVAAKNIGPVLVLLNRASLRPERVIDVGCGDGSLLERMSGHGVASALVGYEIAPSAVEFASKRNIPRVERVELFDGTKIPEPDGSFDLGVLNFVLEHTENPAELLSEVGRVASHVLLSAVLDDTLSARRSGHAEATSVSGHVQRFNLKTIRHLLRDEGFSIEHERVRPPSVAAAVFWREPGWKSSIKAYSLALAKWTAYRIAPPIARQIFAASYRCIATSPGGLSRRR
jgi:SAM-dependent methyltransferase